MIIYLFIYLFILILSEDVKTANSFTQEKTNFLL